MGINGYEIHNTGDGWCLTNRSGAAYDGNWQTMWPNLTNNGYAVSSGGNNSPGSCRDGDCTHLYLSAGCSE